MIHVAQTVAFVLLAISTTALQTQITTLTRRHEKLEADVRARLDPTR